MGYVLITGGELSNKGAQAMTFVTVSEIKRRYPGKKLILLSNVDDERPDMIKEQFSFEIMRYPYNLLYFQSRILSFFIGATKSRNGYFNTFRRILKNTDAIVDISGYSFGSNWGSRHSLYYLLRFRMANVWGIPFYLMPQSFGPFDFKSRTRLINYLSKHTLKKARVIMARESDGKDGLERKYGLKNVILTSDLVLQNQELCLESVYKSVPSIHELDIRDNGVALIPNTKNAKYSSEDFAVDLYKRIVDLLLANNKTVYLIFHSTDDKTLCKKIKDVYYKDDPCVVFIENELSCVELERNLSKFQFVVASRYHSIVHSYKAFVPAVILGWAIKYKELAVKFHQEDFCYDVSSLCDFDELATKIEYMCSNYQVESQNIVNGIRQIQKSNVYDYIDLRENDK